MVYSLGMHSGSGVMGLLFHALDQNQPCSATSLPPLFLFVSLPTSILPKVLIITKEFLQIRMERIATENL